MNEDAKNGVLVCFGETEHKNIGDYIQSVAVAQFAGPDAILVERETMNAYAGDPVRVVMNAWFMHHPDRFPPSPAIIPLFISFHVRPLIEKVFFTDRAIAYLKAHEPIGCRSTDMVDMLARHGIRGEFTSCLTLTLGDTFCDLFYYGEDTEEYRAFLETVKADRAITADFFVPSR